jgi:uncharacterized damage-inducible protein DinB
MTESRKQQHIIHPLPSDNSDVGRWLWAFEDTRQRTKRTLDGVDGTVLDWVAPKTGLSIGTLLYHIAAIEIDWLYTDVLEGKPFPNTLEHLFSDDARDERGRLTLVMGETLEHHLQRLDAVRAHFLEVFRRISVDEFRRPRTFDDYVVTPEWVIHHLMQHEAEHRGQIGEIMMHALNMD